MIKRIRTAAAVLAGAALIASCGTETDEPSDSGLSEVVISGYGTATSSYAELAAVAESITRSEGVQFRIIPSDTGVGRLQPLAEGTANFSRTGDEYWYAFEAMHEYASPEWGPQQLRIVWTPVSLVSFITTSDSGISSPEDLAGKRVPRVSANPSADSKVLALLASAGLTRDDTTPVDIGYGDQPDALQTGQIDVMIMSTDSPSISEMESAVEVDWLELDPSDPQLISAFEEYAPAVRIDEFSGRPGQNDGETDNGMYYPLPIVTYSDRSNEDAYEMTRMIVENYPDYESATNMNYLWSADEVPLVPTVVPFHEGTIQYLEEEGMWSEEAQARQDELLQREESLQEGWQEVVDTADSAELPEAWENWRQENLA